MGTIIHESVLALEKEQLIKQRSESEVRLEKKDCVPIFFVLFPTI